MKIITHKACPLCNSNNLVAQFSCKDYFATGESFEIYKCNDCGFVFTQNVPDETEIGRYYESPEYVSHSDTNKGFINKIYHIVRSIMLRHKVNLVKKLTLLRNGKLLDYDVITLWHVMEHLQNIDAFWEQAKKLLKESGIMIVAVPNCASYDAENYGEYWAAYDVPRHLWHFTSSTMMRMGEKHGFILERRYPMPMDGFSVSMLSEKYKGAKIPFIKGMWNGFLGWIATCDKCSAGSSIIYVFRKKR